MHHHVLQTKSVVKQNYPCICRWVPSHSTAQWLKASSALLLCLTISWVRKSSMARLAEPSARRCWLELAGLSGGFSTAALMCPLHDGQAGMASSPFPSHFHSLRPSPRGASSKVVRLTRGRLGLQGPWWGCQSFCKDECGAGTAQLYHSLLVK